MTEIALKISNHLVMAENHIVNIGLANGRMGIALNLYHASQKLSSKSYRDLADSLLESILRDLENCQNLLFFSGITGISMGLSSLIRDKFIQPEANDLFIDMDRKMFLEARQRKIHDFAEDFSVFSFGLYLLHRIANPKLKMGIPTDEAIDLALSICEEVYAQYFTFDKRSITYTNSVLYFLISQGKNKKYRQRASSITELIVAKIMIAINNDPKLVHHFGTTLVLTKAFDKKNIISNRLPQVLRKFSKKVIQNNNSGKVDIELTETWEGILFSPLYKYSLDAKNVNDWLNHVDLFSDNHRLENVDIRNLILCGLSTINADNQNLFDL